jgi:hypothetical protein
MAVLRWPASMNDHFKRDLSPIQTAMRVLSLGLTAFIAVGTFLIISQFAAKHP